MTTAWVVLIVFAAAILQAITGFGFALVVMPLVVLVLDLQTAAPLVALAGLTTYSVNLVRFRQAIDVGEVARLAAASAIGIPLGIWVLVHVPEAAINRALGSVLVAYAAYSLLRPQAPRLEGRWWFAPAGFLAGLLGGAYNTPGPPVIVYGALRQWPKDEFRAVLQTLFFVNGVLVVASHLAARHMTAQVWRLYFLAAPALLLGLLAGSRLDSKVNQDVFRALVTIAILTLGLSMVLGAGRR